MNWMKLQLSIYESYSNGEMTKDTCDSLINSIYNKIGDSIVEEAENAENEFINASLSVLTENTHDSNLLIEASNTFADKVKTLWEKFKAWLKALINRLFGRKEKPSGKVNGPKGLMNALNTLKSKVKSLKGATGAKVAVAIGGIAVAIAGVKKVLSNKGNTEEVDANAVDKSCKDIMDDCQSVSEDQSKKGIEDKENPVSKIIKALRDTASLIGNVVSGVIHHKTSNQTENKASNNPVLRKEFMDAINKKDNLAVKIMIKDAIVFDATNTKGIRSVSSMLSEAKKNTPEIFDNQEKFDDMTDDKSKWTIDYMNLHLVKLMSGNFTEENIHYLEKVAKVAMSNNSKKDTTSKSSDKDDSSKVFYCVEYERFMNAIHNKDRIFVIGSVISSFKNNVIGGDTEEADAMLKIIKKEYPEVIVDTKNIDGIDKDLPKNEKDYDFEKFSWLMYALEKNFSMERINLAKRIIENRIINK